jgi:hypothetical protein
MVHLLSRLLILQATENSQERFSNFPHTILSHKIGRHSETVNTSRFAALRETADINFRVDLFKRHPTLKYDLVWSVFGLRMQVMLLSESREVVASGYRMIRYAISDTSSLRNIRTLNTDYLVTW